MLKFTNSLIRKITFLIFPLSRYLLLARCHRHFLDLLKERGSGKLRTGRLRFLVHLHFFRFKTHIRGCQYIRQKLITTMHKSSVRAKICNAAETQKYVMRLKRRAPRSNRSSAPTNPHSPRYGSNSDKNDLYKLN